MTLNTHHASEEERDGPTAEKALQVATNGRLHQLRRAVTGHAERSGIDTRPSLEGEPLGDDVFARYNVTLYGEGVLSTGNRLHDPRRYPRIVNQISAVIQKYPVDFLRPFNLKIGLYDHPFACAQEAAGFSDAADVRFAMLIDINGRCGNMGFDRVFHHELMHLLGGPFSSELNEPFIALSGRDYHGEIEKFNDFPRQNGFGDQYARVSAGEDVARTAETLWDGALCDSWLRLDDPIVLMKMQIIARFYQSKSINAPNIRRILGNQEESQQRRGPWDASGGRNSRGSLPVLDNGFLGVEYVNGVPRRKYDNPQGCERMNGGKACEYDERNRIWSFYDHPTAEHGGGGRKRMETAPRKTGLKGVEFASDGSQIRSYYDQDSCKRSSYRGTCMPEMDPRDNQPVWVKRTR